MHFIGRPAWAGDAKAASLLCEVAISRLGLLFWPSACSSFFENPLRLSFSRLSSGPELPKTGGDGDAVFQVRRDRGLGIFGLASVLASGQRAEPRPELGHAAWVNGIGRAWGHRGFVAQVLTAELHPQSPGIFVSATCSQRGRADAQCVAVYGGGPRTHTFTLQADADPSIFLQIFRGCAEGVQRRTRHWLSAHGWRAHRAVQVNL